MTAGHVSSEALQFDQFRLEPERRRLLADGATVALSSRAYDLLEFLIRNRDRIVTRDEIVAHVWHGMAVGENNLSVQMSLLRRALAEHAGKDPLIVNLPGRGYRFVRDVTVALPVLPVLPDLPFAALLIPVTSPHGMPAPATPTQSRRSRWRRQLAAGGMALLFLLVLLCGWAGWWPGWSSLSADRLPDARLSIAVPEFAAVGSDPRTPAAAADYTQAILARFGQFDDIVLFPDHEPVRPRLPAHFRLAGSVQVDGADAVLRVGLIEAATGKLLYRNNVSMPADATVFQQTATAMEMLLDMRPALFHAEAALRRGPARDAMDLVIEAHVAAGDGGQSALALSLAEQAVQRDPANLPARVLLSGLLTSRMLSLPATLGDEMGQRALGLIDGVLLEQPRNFLYIARRAFALQALRRLDEAQATAEQGLQIEPTYFVLIQTLGEVLMQKGELSEAQTLIRFNPRDLGDDRIATLDFTEGKYTEALAATRRIIAASPSDWNMQFTALLEVSVLVQLGKPAEARPLLAHWLATLPKEFQHVSAQRQAFYLLPDVAWQRFKQSLAQAGMPP